MNLTEAIAHSKKHGLPPPVIKTTGKPAEVFVPQKSAEIKDLEPQRKSWLDRMNKTEREYAAMLEKQRRDHRIRRWAFEEISFNLGEGAFFTPDFYIEKMDGSHEFHETKGGFIREAALVRFKAAKSKFSPFGEFRMMQKIDGEWRRLI